MSDFSTQKGKEFRFNLVTYSNLLVGCYTSKKGN